jgi:sirohydrochlorin cobaltochelatase
VTGELGSLLAQLLSTGRLRAGQIEIRADGNRFELRHQADAAAAELEIFERPEDARQLALYDEAGAYRPLKTSPNLRRGWRLRLRTIAELHRALDYFYPAMLGVWRDFHSGSLARCRSAKPSPARPACMRSPGKSPTTRRRR